MKLFREAKGIAKQDDHRVAARNPTFFGSLFGDITEGYAANTEIKDFLRGYETFFDDSEEWIRIRNASGLNS